MFTSIMKTHSRSTMYKVTFSVFRFLFLWKIAMVASRELVRKVQYSVLQYDQVCVLCSLVASIIFDICPLLLPQNFVFWQQSTGAHMTDDDSMHSKTDTNTGTAPYVKQKTINDCEDVFTIH